MSPSKSFKLYLKKLRASGLPTCKAKLLELSEMGQSAAFQWFMENRYVARPTVDALASDEGNWMDEILDAEDDDSEDEIAPAIVEAVTKPKAKRTRKVDVEASDEGNRFNAGLYAKYSITPKVGAEFKTKRRGTTWVITSVAADHIRAARKA